MHSLVLGKFHNYHKGHFNLIKFACSISDKVTVMICHEDADPIELATRKQWIHRDFGNLIDIIVVRPSDENLSNKSESDREVSKEWAAYIDSLELGITHLVGSEEYVNYCAEYGNFEGIVYDQERTGVNCSSTSVRENDLHHYYSPSAQQDRVLRIGLIGPESCGKSWVTRYLEAAYNYEVITEQARDMMSDTHYTMHDTMTFGVEQLSKVLQSGTKSSTVIVDSTAVTSSVYSFERFGSVDALLMTCAIQEPIDVYLLFKPNTEFVQDGTRVQTQEERDKWFTTAQDMLESFNKNFIVISSPEWDDRTAEVDNAVKLIQSSNR